MLQLPTSPWLFQRWPLTRRPRALWLPALWLIAGLSSGCSTSYKICVNVKDGANGSLPTELLLVFPSEETVPEWADVKTIADAHAKLKDFGLHPDTRSVAYLGVFQPSSSDSGAFLQTDSLKNELVFSSDAPHVLVFSNFKGKELQSYPTEPIRNSVYIVIEEADLRVSFPEKWYCAAGRTSDTTP